MDYSSIINDLHVQLERLDRAIAHLESPNSADGTAPPKRRGRKSMGEAERQQVSERMIRYWAAQREERNRRDAGLRRLMERAAMGR